MLALKWVPQKYDGLQDQQKSKCPGTTLLHCPGPVVFYDTHNALLVGGFNHVLFSIIYGIILPIDFHIFHIFQDG